MNRGKYTVFVGVAAAVFMNVGGVTRVHRRSGCCSMMLATLVMPVFGI
jgi:hypothetical protein